MKRLISILLIAAMLLAVMVVPGFAANGTEPAYGDADLSDSDYDGIPDAYDVAPQNNVFPGKMRSGHNSDTTVSFTMDYRNFFGDNTAYHAELASVSVIGSALAYTDDAYYMFNTPQTWAGGTTPDHVYGPQLMEVLGFEDVVDFKLDSTYDDDDLCEVIIGHRTVNSQGETKVVVALWVRGTNPESIEEWSSNFNVGNLLRFFDEYDSVSGKSPRQSNADWTRKTNHRGFDVSATRILNYLGGYHESYVQPVLDALEGEELVYWVTGHSRGAAVGNLIASYLIDDGMKVFAYTFAAPYNTANTEASAQ